MPQTNNNPYEHTWVAPSITPGAARTTTTTGSAVDTTVNGGYDKVLLVVSTGTVTDGTHTFKVTQSATSGGSYTDAAASQYLGAEIALDTTAAHDNAVFVQGFTVDSTKPFVKAVCTVAGGPATGAEIAACFVMPNSDQQPVSQNSTS